MISFSLDHRINFCFGLRNSRLTRCFQRWTRKCFLIGLKKVLKRLSFETNSDKELGDRNHTFLKCRAASRCVTLRHVRSFNVTSASLCLVLFAQVGLLIKRIVSKSCNRGMMHLTMKGSSVKWSVLNGDSQVVGSNPVSRVPWVLK